MLLGKNLFGETQEIDFTNPQAGFFLGFATSRLRGPLHRIHLAANDIPVASLGCVDAAIQQHQTIGSADHETDANTRESMPGLAVM